MKKKVEKIKLFNLDKSKIVKRHTSKNSRINTTCSCLNCLNFNQMKWQNELNIEETDCLNVDETKMNKTKQNLTSSKTEYNLTQDDLNQNSCLNQLKSKYIHGLIKIQDSNRIISNSEGSLYLRHRFEASNKINEQLKLAPKFMSTIWNMKSPQIIIPIITGISNFRNWKNQKLEETFRRGIIKAANKTEMWFITNGINGGISSMVGEAFNEERLSRATKSTDKTGIDVNFLNDTEINQKGLTLIGIIDSKWLQNSSSFDGMATVLTTTGNKTAGRLYRFDANSDHTHFLIFDEEPLKQENEDNKLQLTYDQYRNKIESLFTWGLSTFKRNFNSELSDDDADLTSKLDDRRIPMVCLTIRGDLSSIDAIEFKIRREIPVIILKGSGAVADIIAFAHEELTENKDTDYEDNFIKPEISKKILDEFKDDLNKNDVLRNQYRDKILSIVKNGTKGTRKFLTVVDMKSQHFDFDELDKYILTVLLQSQTQLQGKQGKAQLDQNLRLTLDWNCPNIALSEIFQRDDYTQIEIKHNIFENALIRTDREEFVELFLDQGFYIHRYLGRNNIRDLFTKSYKKEFFFTVILQGILGHFTNELPDNFLPDGLNLALKELTSIDNMINILEIYMNQLRFYTTDAHQAEKKALNFLIIFAVIFNRHKLAKILWKRSQDPLPLALVCSLIYKNMLPYCQESYLKQQIEQHQNDFANSAIGLLEMSFQENDPRSYSVLSEKYPDYHDLTVLELAYNAKNKDFIAHPCCQKILTKRLFGQIIVRDVDNNFIEVPTWLKVILSAFFIFPMYFWIIFPIAEKKITKRSKKSEQNQQINASQTVEEFLDDDDKDEEQQEAEETKAELNKKLLSEIKNNRKFSQSRLKSSLNKQESLQTADKKIEKCREYVTPPFYKKIYLLWHSPYTKFWINFLAYVCFLTLFGIVTLWPCCGNLILDSTLWLWTATIAIEDTRIAYNNYLTGSQLPITVTIIEISIMILFLILFFFVRIIGSWDGFIILGIDRIFASKFVLCFFLLYFYYRTLFIFLPISHQLGPMLLRMKLMLQKDFTTYLRLFIIFMTASGIALNSIIYPFHPLNYELLKKVFLFKGFLQIFTAEKTDLERSNDECRISGLNHKIVNENYSCVGLTNGIDFSYSEEKLQKYGVYYKCNYMSVTAWVILIQYFLLVKLFLPSLLTAMFSATGSRVSAQSEQLWMFQRYQIVLDYEKRLILPPPFTLISYAYMILKWIFNKIKRLFKKCKICCKCFCFQHQYNKENQRASELISKISAPTEKMRDDQMNTKMFCYWRSVAQKYSADAEKESKEKAKQKQIETNMNKVREDLYSQKKSMQRLNDRVISLEKSLVLNQSYLEQIKNLLSQKVSKSGLLDRKKNNYVHILSRESPYANTNIPRFFVYEKLVPWEINYDLYDPPLIILSAEMFKNIHRIFIDEEPNLRNQEAAITHINVQMPGPPPPPQLNHSIQSVKITDTPSSPISQRYDSTNIDQSRTRRNSLQSLQTKQNLFLWNAVTFIDSPFQPGKRIAIDRTSWITRIDEQTSQSFPLIYSLDSAGYPRNPIGRTGVRGKGALMRYGPNKEIMAIVTRWKKTKNRPIFVERRKLLEFISVKDEQTGLSRIPGEKILGDESKYSVVCRSFSELFEEEFDSERGTNFTSEEMNRFFCSFASDEGVTQKNSLHNFSNSEVTTDKVKKQNLNDYFNEYGFVPTMIYNGYIDDPKNTDNAWVEGEIWNFHYDKEDFFDKRIKNAPSKWREVSSNVKNSNEIISDVLKEIAEMHDGFYN